MSGEEIFNDRKNKFLKIGRTKGFINNLEDLSSLETKQINFEKILKYKKVLITAIGLISIFSIIAFIYL